MKHASVYEMYFVNIETLYWKQFSSRKRGSKRKIM